MKCPFCGKEMREGYLFGSKDGAVSFANEVPSALKSAKSVPGFVEIKKLQSGGRTHVTAKICEECRKGIFEY